MRTSRTLAQLLAARTGESAQVELSKLLQTFGVTLQRENVRAVLRRLGDSTAASSTALADP